MVAAANVVEVAALVGDTARATMLAALMGGESLTATELAYLARVTRSTASGHLAKLVNARLLVVTRKRRFAYYRIASPLVAAHDGKHQGGRRDRGDAAPPAALGERRRRSASPAAATTISPGMRASRSPKRSPRAAMWC